MSNMNFAALVASASLFKISFKSVTQRVLPFSSLHIASLRLPACREYMLDRLQALPASVVLRVDFRYPCSMKELPQADFCCSNI